MSLFEFDKGYNVNILCGVDEAGRGPLAGPVVAAAVVLKPDAEAFISEVNDSKKISEKKREKLYDKIIENSLYHAVGVVDVDYIEKYNILQATFLAMKKAVEQIKVEPELVLVDGNRLPDLKVRSEFVIKGDSKSASIAAASIVAKVTRDRMMVEFHEKYPNYGFDRHKGYGTKEHYSNIIKYGVTPIHRMSFLKKIREKISTVQSINGQLGEKITYEWLKRNNYNVIAKNYKSEYGEIDLIAVKDNYICFVEVKLRSENCGYSPRESVNLAKQKKIIKTAISFLKKHPCEYQPRFDVSEVMKKTTGDFKIEYIEDAFSVGDEYELF